LPIFLLRKNKLTPETSAKTLVVLEKNHAQRHVSLGDSTFLTKTLNVPRGMVTSFVGSNISGGQAKWFIASWITCCVAASGSGGGGNGNKKAPTPKMTHNIAKKLNTIFMM
jgi:hypothetical protein